MDQDIEHRKGPLGGQLYEHKWRIDADIFKTRDPLYLDEEIHRRLNQIQEDQEVWAARHGQYLTDPIVSREDFGDHVVYTTSREGFPQGE